MLMAFQSVAAGDHLIAVLELHQTAIHLAARQHEANLAFASMRSQRKM